MTRIIFIVGQAIAVSALALVAILLTEQIIGDAEYLDPRAFQQPKTDIDINRHLNDAGGKAANAIATRSAEFAEYIDSRKAGAQPFAEDITSWTGKWKAIEPFFPFSRSDGHEKFVQEKFGQHIFSEKELADAMRRAIEGSIRDIEQIENELAVHLYQEVLGRSLSPNEVALVEEHFRITVDQIVAAARVNAGKGVASLVASEVVAQVASQVLIRLGVSTGILATGAANSMWTLGSALGIGIVVSMVWEWVDDPTAEIVEGVTLALNHLSIQASGEFGTEMNMIINQRSEIWKSTASSLLSEHLL